jgi:trimeric autotransporter adhesin
MIFDISGHRTCSRSSFHLSVFSISTILILLSFQNGFSQIESKSSGNWSSPSNWVGGKVPTSSQSARIKSGHTLTLVGSANSITNLEIEEGATLTDNGNSSNTVSGNLILNGTWAGSGSISLTGTNATISGTGSFTNTADLSITGSKTILAGSNLSKNSGNVTITNAGTITNNGQITIGGNISGVSGTTWVNGAGSTLNVGGEMLTTSGTILNASASGNTVNYFGSVSQLVKQPSVVAATGLPTYHHLILSGSGTKTLGGTSNLDITGDLTNSATFSIGAASGVTSTRVVYLKGNWTSSSTFTRRSGTIVIDGAGAQTLTKTTGTETFYNLTFNKTSGTVTINNNVVVENILRTESTNNINILLGNNLIAVGTSTSAVGEVQYFGSGYFVGSFKKWFNQTGTLFTYPIGTAQQYRPASITFNTLTKGGSLIAAFVSSSPGNITAPPLNDAGTSVYNLFRDGYWSLSAPSSDSLATSDYSIELTGNGFTGFSITPSTRIVTRSSSAAAWALAGAHVAANGSTAKRSNLSYLSAEFAFADITNCARPATSAISGNDVVCKGASGEIYSVTPSPGNTYNWSVNGGTILSGAGTSSITVNWGSTGMAGSVSVVEGNSCTQGSEVVKTVTIKSLPPAISAAKYYVPENGEAAVRYSVTAVSGNTYTWNVTGGTIQSGQNTNSITVKWGAKGLGTVCATATDSGCPAAPSTTCVNITIYDVITSVRSGQYNAASTWDCACVPSAVDNVVIKNTHTVTVPNSTSAANHVVINAGGTLNAGSNAARTLTIAGDLTINGVLTSVGTLNLTASGSNVSTPVIDGSGTISHTGAINIRSARVIESATFVKATGTVTLDAGVTVINKGTVTLGGNLAGSDATSAWINESGATLSVAGSLLTTGALYASADGNTVAYTRADATAQDIKIPDGGQYSNLTVSGGTKLVPVGTVYISGNFVNNASSFIHNTSGTIIFNGTSEISGTGTPEFHHLTVSQGAVLTSSSGSVGVRGNLANYGTFNHNGGTILLNGSSGSSSIFGNAITFRNITGSNTNGIYVNAPVSVEGVVNLAAATSLFTEASPGGSLTLKSTFDAPAQDASIGSLLNGANVVGNVTVERYVGNFKGIYRYIAAPVYSATVEDWIDDFEITGAFANPSAGKVCGVALRPTSASLFYFDEARGGLEANRYVAFPQSAKGESRASDLVLGRGYTAYIRRCSPLLIDVKGPIHVGNFDFNLSYTSSATAVDGYNLIGNPYASAIDWSADAGWSRSANIGLWAVVRNNKTGGFEYLNAEAASGVIAQGQAFWVQVLNNSVAPSLTINENAKTTAATVFYREEITDELKIVLSNQSSSDEVTTRVHSKSNSARDIYDAVKMSNDNFDVYAISSDNFRLAVNSVPSVNCSEPVRIGIRNLKTGTYKINLEPLGQFNSMAFTLRDNYTRTDVRMEELTYEFTVNTEPASYHQERFVLYMEERTDLPPAIVSYNPVTCDGPAPITIENSQEGITYSIYTSKDSVLASLKGSNGVMTYVVPESVMENGENTFYLKSHLGCGGLAEERVISITHSAVPEPLAVSGGKTCGPGNVNLEVSTSGSDRVDWFASEDSNEILFSGSTFATGDIGKSTSYYFQITNSEGCRSQKYPARAEVVAISAPVVAEAGPAQLSSDIDETFWYHNGQLIGAGAQVSVGESGVYVAEVVQQGCTARTEHALVISATEESETGDISLYPNPAVSFVRISESGQVLHDVVFLDMKGIAKTVGLALNQVPGARTYDISSLPTGVYVVRITSDGGITTRTLVKD